MALAFTACGVSCALESEMSEEVALNGDVPRAWYRGLAHVGYNLSGKRLLSRERTDAISNLLRSVDGRSSWRDVSDLASGNCFKLSGNEIRLLNRIKSGSLPTDPFSGVTLETNDRSILFRSSEPKRRFIASKWEAKTVLRLVRALRLRQRAPARALGAKTDKSQYFDIWSKDESKRGWNNLSPVYAPKSAPPGNRSSFNPPAEYISYLGLSGEGPGPTLRQMCSYERFMKERFERCLDLYLCPRSNRNKLKMIPDDLLLNVPSRETLKPYPEILSQEYHSPATKVNAISVHHSGELLACSTSSGRIIIWEVHTGKSIKQFDFDVAPTHISWHPTKAEGLMTVLGNCVIVMDSLKVENVIITCLDRALKTITWRNDKHYCLLHHTSTVNEAVWHPKGRYFSTVFGDKRDLLIHSIEQNQSQAPFIKYNGPINGVLFHPTKPLFIICSPRSVQMYNLKTQVLERKFARGMTVNTCMSMSPSGSSFIVGSQDGKVLWYDVDRSEPCKVISLRRGSISSVAWHPSYPLLATAGHNGDVNLFHMSEAPAEPLIIPINLIRSVGSKIHSSFSMQFHPQQPWLFFQDNQQEKSTILLYSET